MFTLNTTYQHSLPRRQGLDHLDLGPRLTEEPENYVCSGPDDC